MVLSCLVLAHHHHYFLKVLKQHHDIATQWHYWVSFCKSADVYAGPVSDSTGFSSLYTADIALIN